MIITVFLILVAAFLDRVRAVPAPGDDEKAKEVFKYLKASKPKDTYLLEAFDLNGRSLGYLTIIEPLPQSSDTSTEPGKSANPKGSQAADVKTYFGLVRDYSQEKPPIGWKPGRFLTDDEGHLLTEIARTERFYYLSYTTRDHDAGPIGPYQRGPHQAGPSQSGSNQAGSQQAGKNSAQKSKVGDYQAYWKVLRRTSFRKIRDAAGVEYKKQGLNIVDATAGQWVICDFDSKKYTDVPSGKKVKAHKVGWEILGKAHNHGNLQQDQVIRVLKKEVVPERGG